MDTKPLNVLSVDAGGMRGMSSLLVLKSLMLRLRTRSKSKTDPRPCEVFELICGTSTGGLIAIMLGRLRMSIDEAILCYVDLSKEVFGEKSTHSSSPHRECWRIVYRLLWSIYGDEKRDGKGGRDTAMYDASILERCVKEFVAAHHGGDACASLEDSLAGEKGCCNTFVAAVHSYDDPDSSPKIFRSYPTNGQPADKCTIWEAARATTAMHPFFPSMSVGDPPMTFLGKPNSPENNPSQLAVNEAREVFPGRRIGCFLSLGTGVPDVVSATGNQVKIGEACNEIMSSCELVDDAVGQHFLREPQDDHLDRYFRFSVDRCLESIALDECNHLQDLAALTNGYMRGYLEEARAKKCVEALTPSGREVEALREDKVSLI